MTTSDRGLVSLLWCERLLSELASLGVDTVFVSPGSRSTPLMLAAARQKSLAVHGHFDERGLAFLALGYARARRRPAVVITTSGTAVANLFPAIVEASQDHVPMLVLTADRPNELRGTGANQTIDQVHIFGRYVRSFLDVPCPEDQRDLESAAELARESFSRAEFGPVHLST